MIAVDKFAGLGGWDLALEFLGIPTVGIEWDDAACATRYAAGLQTVQADVAGLDPGAFRLGVFGERDDPLLLIGSPPCQAFSMAGKGEGRRAIVAYLLAIEKIWERGYEAWADGGVKDLDAASGDPRGHLVLEPLRWAIELRPEAIALEQVEPVLPLWEAIGGVLRKMGYSVWTGVLSAEQYGVPQTRRRAILIASRVRTVTQPVPTHQRWMAPRNRPKQEESLFEAPEPQRIVHPDDRGLLPWVSMAEALGWQQGASVQHRRGAERLEEEWSAEPPADTITTRVDRWQVTDQVGLPRRADNDNVLVVDGVEYRDRDLRPASEPAATLTEKTRSWLRFRATSGRPNATERDENEPAPALAFGHNAPVWLEGEPPTHYDTRQTGNTPRSVDDPAPTMLAEGLKKGVPVWLKAGTGEHEAVRSEDEPAPTLRFGQRLNSVEWVSRTDRMQWTEERPATTVAGDTRVHPPGHKENSGDEPGRFEQRRGENAVRVSLAEALVLQSFPPDYPVQGTKTKQFEQVGNAIPPLLALRVLEAAI